MVINRRGWTFTEALMVLTILGVLVLLGPKLMIGATKNYLMNKTRVQLQRDARATMDMITRNLRQAQSMTVKLDRVAGQPPYSRVTFTKQSGAVYSFYQSGTKLIHTNGTKTQTLSQDLRFLTFTFPKSDNLSIVSVAVTLERTLYDGRTKALHMASEKVRVMNP